MRLYFKNRRSPKAYKVIISSQENSHIGFIGAVTNPTMKIGNGVVQFYLAPIASKGTWTINEDYHFKDGNLTLMAYKNLNYTSYNSHATYSDFTPNIQKALSYLEFHNFETISDSVRIITGLSDATWMYDQENNKFLFFTEFESGSLTPLRLASQINLLLNSDDSVLKYNAELFVKELILDLFKPSPKGLLSDSLFSSSFRNNAVITVLGEDEYKDTYLDSNTTSSLNFSQGFTDRIPSTNWYAEGNGQIVEGGEAFSHTVFKTGKDETDSLQTPSKLLTGGSTPFTLSFDLLIKEDQVVGDSIPLLSKNSNTYNGEQGLYISTDGRLVFERKANVGGNHIIPVTGLRRIEHNTKFTILIVYDGNMFKVFVDDVLDLQFGSIVGIHTDTDQPYRFMNNLVPSYIDYRSVTNGYIDNIQVQDGVALDPTKEYDAYQENLVSQLRFQGQVGKTSFVDEANDQIKWMGYGDAKLVEGSELGLYSYLSLDGMGSYIKTLDSDPFKFNNKFTIHFKFKTSTVSKRQVLLDRYEGTNETGYTVGSYQVSINTDGKLFFTVVKEDGWHFLESVATGLNNGLVNTIDIVKDGESLSMYVNGLLDSMHDVSGDIFNGTVVNTSIGAQINLRNEEYDFKGNIYEYSIYKGVAVYPEVKAKELNKVELNFDKGVPLDVYNNSTWTVDSGVTFDKTYSNFGHGAYYDGTWQGIVSGLNNVFNYESDDFKISLDINPVEPGRQYGSRILCSDQVTNYSPVVFSILKDTNTFYANFRSDVSGITYGLSSQIGLNTYNHIEVFKIDTYLLLFVNNVLKSFSTNIPKTESFNLNGGGKTILGTSRNDLDGTRFKGYLDNFKSDKGSVDQFKIDRPVIHLPLESNVGNLGITNLEVTSVGNPTFHVIEDKKCIKFENGKYLTINSNNIFNLGTSSDFYIEFDFYPLVDKYHHLISAGSSVADLTTIAMGRDESPDGNSVYVYAGGDYILTTEGVEWNLNKFNNIKLYRKGTLVTLSVNGHIFTTTTPSNFDFSKSYTTIGQPQFGESSYCDGYMSDFKMYVGTSEPVESYDHRKVLNLDFKPTYKSYLFKDNYNKMVIHPVGISYRGYENGRYCLNLNGTDQYLSLGKSNLLNFGTNDFIIKMEFSVKSFRNSWQTLLSTGDSYAALSVSNQGVLRLKASVLTLDSPPNTIELNTTYKLIMYKENGKVSVKLNDTILVDAMNAPVSFNMNSGDNTYIGCSNVPSNYLEALLFTVTILRDTADLSLLDKEILVPEDPGDGIIIDGPPPLEKGILRFWEERKEIDPHNVVLEFKQLRLSD